MNQFLAKQRSPASLPTLLSSALILLLAFAIRAYNLYETPVFIDEANHLLWTQRLSHGEANYPLLLDGKFFLGMYSSLFELNGPAPLWIARMSIAIFALINVAVTIHIATWLARSQAAGLIAGCLYALLPASLFYERQFLADPLLAAGGGLFVLVSLRLMINRQSNRYLPALAGLALAIAILSKLYAGVYLAIFIPALILKNSSQRRTLALQYAAIVGVTLVTIALSLTFYWPWLGMNDGSLVSQQIGFIGCPPLLCQLSWTEQINVSLTFVRDGLVNNIGPYWGWGIVAVAALGLPMVALAKRNRPMGALWLGTLAMVMLFGLMSKGYTPSRYLVFMTMPIVVGCGLAIEAIARKLPSRFYSLFNLLGLIALITLSPIRTTWALVSQFEQVAVPQIDLIGYAHPFWPGQGVQEATRHITDSDTDSAAPPVVLLIGKVNQVVVSAYLNPARIDLRGAGDAQVNEVAHWLTNRQRLFILGSPDATPPSEFEVTKPILFPEGSSSPTIAVWQVIKPSRLEREAIYRQVFIEPDKLTDEYQNFFESLPESSPASVLLYPPNQATLFSSIAVSKPNIHVIGIGDSWPLDFDALKTEIPGAIAGSPDIFAVFVEETKGDPQRWIENELNDDLFRVSEDWYGPIRVVHYFNPEDYGFIAASIPDIRFGDSITLSELAQPESPAAAGGYLPLQITWTALGPTHQPYKVFVHLFQGEQTVAQYDSQPRGGLKPTNTWQPGETIVDRFVIQVPDSLGVGVYQLRIGWYSITDQTRLPVTASESFPDGFIVCCQIEVK